MTTPLNRVLRQLIDVLTRDVQGYRELRTLLDAQFDAALAHHAASMDQLAGRIVTQVEGIDARRESRDGMLAQLAGRRERPGLRALAARLPAAVPLPLRERLAEVCGQLEQLTVDCKRLNLRNCELIHEQHALMQRLLGQPEASYAQP
ncbi:flagellar protein FlgN [Roseateles sp. BYS78W]|uniref:Flagellar protein FlgN n=1 Tax=Pelomonas candidula TaxID=3299025 RepID=A0ABW7HGF3_9BURK